MTSRTVTMSRALAERLLSDACNENWSELNRLLAAQEATRQEPVYQVAARLDNTKPAWTDVDKESFDDYAARGNSWLTRTLYISPPAPLSPDHSGGAGVVLPDRNTIYVTKPIFMDGTELIQVWQACLDKVKELNQ